MGSLRGGHYTATVLSNEDKTWYELDDTRVRKVIVKSIYVARMKQCDNKKTFVECSCCCRLMLQVEEQPFEKNRIYKYVQLIPFHLSYHKVHSVAVRALDPSTLVNGLVFPRTLYGIFFKMT